MSSAFVVAALSVLSASAQLNPTVKVLPKPQSTVPPECEQGLAPAAPRVIIAETAAEETKPTRAAAPPSLDLKTRLRAVQVTAERNDRDAFKAALADARAAVASYPSGGERSAANDVINVYNDLERLWDYQFTSPTGAFFDASTDFVGMMRRYSDYSRSIANQTLNVAGQIVYPTEETRHFLLAEAARRLDRLGVRTPTRIIEAPPPPVVRVQPAPLQPVPRAVPEKPAPRKIARAAPRKTAPRKPAARKTTRATPRKTTKKPKPVKVAEATTTPPKPHVTEAAPPPPAPVPVPAPVAAPAPAPTPVPAPTPAPMPAPAPVLAPAPVAQPIAPAPATKPVPQPTPTETTVTTATTLPPTATTATTTTTAPPQNQPQAGGRMNLLFAIILIIIGIGVLIVLFRASD